MKMIRLNLIIIISLAFLITMAQEIKFPKSSLTDASHFEGMKSAEIYPAVQAKYHFSTSQKQLKVANKIDYEKLSKAEIKYFLTKETAQHKLGSVTKYSYTTQNAEKETNYSAQNGQLAFSYERKYQYSNNDLLLFESQYSEIPSAEYPEYISDHYHYDLQDSLILIVSSVNNKVTDSVFTQYKKNDDGRVLVEYTTKKSIGEGASYSSEIQETQYNYNEDGQLLSKTIIVGNDVTNEYRYEYDEKKKLRKLIYNNFEFQQLTTETYNSDKQLIQTEAKRNDDSLYIERFKYNAKGLEIERNKYEGDKLVYRYVTTYDATNRKIKYEMIDMKDKSSGIWLYEYDKENRLKYKIDLFWRKEKPETKTQVMETIPTSVGIPPKTKQ